MVHHISAVYDRENYRVAFEQSSRLQSSRLKKKKEKQLLDGTQRVVNEHIQEHD
jgi:hypothetical protein